MTLPMQGREVTPVALSVTCPKIPKDGKLNSNHEVTVSDR